MKDQFEGDQLIKDYILHLLQAEAETSYRELLDLSCQRRVALEQHKTLYEFYRDLDEKVDWIREEETIAGSEDCGKDLEHVEVSVVCIYHMGNTWSLHDGYSMGSISCIHYFMNKRDRCIHREIQ